MKDDASSSYKAFRRRDTRMPAYAPGERPHDLSLEKAVLAGVICSSEALAEVQEKLKAEDFFFPAHREVYSCIQKLSMANVPVDLRTLSSRLRDDGRLQEIGGDPYLTDILSSQSTALHTVQYAGALLDLSWRRRLIEASEFCRSAALEAGDTREIAGRIEQQVFNATQMQKVSTVGRLGDLVGHALEEFERREQTRDLPVTSVFTGLLDLDRMLAGFRPGQLVVLAAGPGMGKTSLAMNIMLNATVQQKKNVMFFSLEMTQQELLDRIMSAESLIDAGKLRTGHLQHKDFDALYHAAERLQHANLYIDDRSMVSPFDVLATARKVATELRLKQQNSESKIDLIVVDYIQIMKSGSSAENRALEVAAITGGLKMIAKEMKVPVLALSQLNRERSKRTDNTRPQLSDLKDSGAIEADADVVIFIHKEPGPQNDSRAPTPAELIVAKQRSGPTGKIDVTWRGEYTRFENASTGAYPPLDYDGSTGSSLPAHDPANDVPSYDSGF